MSTQELIAQFLAKGGKVTQVTTGDRTITEREFYRARKEDRKVLSAEQRAIEERHYVTGSNGVEHCRNGLGEWLY